MIRIIFATLFAFFVIGNSYGYYDCEIHKCNYTDYSSKCYCTSFEQEAKAEEEAKKQVLIAVGVLGGILLLLAVVAVTSKNETEDGSLGFQPMINPQKQNLGFSIRW